MRLKPKRRLKRRQVGFLKRRLAVGNRAVLFEEPGDVVDLIVRSLRGLRFAGSGVVATFPIYPGLASVAARK